ncbi:MAG: geranylgeranyl reductase family protein [Rhodothermales bacterium]|nr:geranylgeranyl reductase family protein [Rhodothermales bacterium]MBO6778969.1 geranylgeranyl reductase family protein [Rhodothermales bacterium]
MVESFDAIVVGAGPGGATVSALLARKGQRVLVLDKSEFPRDKICGDGISGKSMDAIRELGLEDQLRTRESLGSWGVTFSGPYGDQVSIPFGKQLAGKIAPGFVCAREVFDQVLFDAALDAGAEIRLRTSVTGLLRDGDRVTGVRYRTEDKQVGEIHAPVVIGADGAYSIVARELGMDQLDEKHYVAAVRAYFDNVDGFTDGYFIELHFVDEVIPGYFWIFPMAEGRANVGVGMLSAEIKKRDVKLKPLLDQMIAHPRFRERFRNATQLTPTKGWGLPVGSKPRTMAGDGWMLIGDAASLIDPFTGEGIGNAMVSGMKAAEWLERAAAKGDYSARFLGGYEQEVLGILRNEFRLSHMMQKLGRWKWLLNTVIAKASRSGELADAISCMFDDLSERKKLLTPGFYWRVLTA